MTAPNTNSSFAEEDFGVDMDMATKFQDRLKALRQEKHG